MEKDYGEILCTAIDSIVSSRLQGLSYDITKQYVIKDDSHAYEGKYVVSDGGARFEAFSSDTSFKNGNSVLVTIPNGDYTMQKMIIGRIASVDTTPFKYVSPLDSMLKIENRLLDTIQIPETSLLANRDGLGWMVECFTIPKEIICSDAFQGYTRLGIQADFKSLLSGMDAVEGTYGLKILVKADTLTAPGEISEDGIWELLFDSRDMIGNPYQFTTYFQQEKVFDISNMVNIKEITVYFYQNGDFKDIEGNIIPHKYSTYIPVELNKNIYNDTKDSYNYYYFDNNSGSYKPIKEWPANDYPIDTRFAYLDENYLLNNLYVNNFKLYLGYETERYNGETLEIFPKDAMLNYHHSRKNEIKKVGLRWIHQDDDGNISLLEEKQFEGLEEFDGLPQFEVQWFKYNFGHPIVDKYAKVNWERLKTNIDYINKDTVTEDMIGKENIVYAYQNENGGYSDIISWPNGGFPTGTKFFEKVITDNPLFELSFIPNINLQTEKIKVVGLIRKRNGFEFDKEEIEASGGSYAKLVDIQDAWNIYYYYKEDGKNNPIPSTERYYLDKNEYKLIKEGTEVKVEEQYVKLKYDEIIGLQSKVGYIPKTETVNGVVSVVKIEAKENTQYLEDLSKFIQSFNLHKKAYLLTPFYSKELVYTNEEKVVDELTFDAATALSIVCEDGSDGNYLIYDQNGKIKNEGQGQGYERNFKLAYRGEEINLGFDKLDEIDWVEWLLPSDYFDAYHTSTMLSIPNIMNYTNRVLLDGVDYVAFKYEKEYVPIINRYPGQTFTKEIFMSGTYYIQNADNTSKYDEIKEWIPDKKEQYYEYRFNQFMQPYSIRNQWTESASNNIVRVSMSLKGNTYEALEDMKFGKGGSNGTNATFLLEFLDNANALEAKNNAYVKVKARLYEGSTECEIPFADLNNNVNWLQWKFDLDDHEDFMDIQLWKKIDGIPIYESGKTTLYTGEENKVALNPLVDKGNGKYELQEYNSKTKYFIKNIDGKFTEKKFDDGAAFKAYIGYDPTIRYIRFNRDATENDFKNNFHILQGTYKWNNIDLIAYLSIPLKFSTSDINISHIEGTKEVNYNHQGQPSYYASPYKLFKRDSSQPYQEITNIEWLMNNQDLAAYKKIDKIINEENYNQGLKTKSFYYCNNWSPYAEIDNLTQETVRDNLKYGYRYYYDDDMRSYPIRTIEDFPIFNEFGKTIIFYESKPIEYILIEDFEDFSIDNAIFFEVENKDITHIPSLKTVNSKKVFIPSIYFAEGAQNKICVYCKDADNYYWSQPILIYKHRYDFDILNSWNGGLKTNEADGTIMANMLGAGRKNEDNTFSGVIIGDMAKGTGNENTYVETGVYGLYHGDVSYALKDDGTATFGVAGRGQIQIDGNNSTIQSASYAKGLGGLLIDLDDGIIDISEKDTSAQAAFRMTSKDDTILINLDRNDQYLRSNKYEDANGMEVNLGEGIIKVAGEKGSITIQKDDPYLTIAGIQNKESHILMQVGNTGYYLRSYNYSSTDEQAVTNNGNLVYSQGDSYHAKYLDDEKWGILTKEGDSYFEGSTSSVNEDVDENDEDYKAAVEAWKSEDNERKEPNATEKAMIIEEVRNSRVNIFEAGLKPVNKSYGAGLNFDLVNGQIIGYDIKLRAIHKASNDSLLIDSAAENYPLTIGSNFKVTWDGELKCSKWHYGAVKDAYKDYLLCMNNNFRIKKDGSGYISTAGYAYNSAKLEGRTFKEVVDEASEDSALRDKFNTLVRQLSTDLGKLHYNSFQI